MKLPPALEATLLEPHVVAACPTTCCFNRTCPERVQRVAERLWISATLTRENYRSACYRFEHLARDVQDFTGVAAPPEDADALYELLMERVALSDPPPVPPREAARTDPEALALQEKVLKLRDAARHRREAETKAAYDASHPQQELGV